jgi:ADP-ribosylglycohydrolase
MTTECIHQPQPSITGIASIPDDRLDRYRGCLLGLAVGDALGATAAFKRPGTFKPATEMTGGGSFRLQPGQWGGGTSMALCLAESVLTCQGFDPVDQLRRYVRWWTKGHLSSTGRCFYISNTVRRALGRFLDTGEPCCGRTGPHSACNGSIARLAPVAMAYASRPGEAISRAADSSRTTHAVDVAVDACRYMAGILVGALNGVGKHALLVSHYSPIRGHWKRGFWDDEALVPGIDIVAGGSFRWREPPEIRGAGHVVSSLEAALWAFDRSESFEEGCLMAVNLGDDADTTAAVYGQIAGAFYGAKGIPEAWLDKLAMADTIRALAKGLYDLSRQNHAGKASE